MTVKEAARCVVGLAAVAAMGVLPLEARSEWELFYGLVCMGALGAYCLPPFILYPLRRTARQAGGAK